MNVHRMSRIAAAVAALAPTLPALATEEAPAQPPQALQRVIVTGSKTADIGQDAQRRTPAASTTYRFF
ncbi:MAG TPA: hypothetical protein VIN58_11670 [Roseateles sp.]